MKILTVNRLTEQVTINQPQMTADESGGQVVTWSTLATVYAEVVAISNYTTSRNLGDGVTAAAGYKVTIRSGTPVDASMQIVWKTHTLAIGSLHEIDDTLEILTYEASV